jgi:hypothetical protein
VADPESDLIPGYQRQKVLRTSSFKTCVRVCNNSGYTPRAAGWPIELLVPERFGRGDSGLRTSLIDAPVARPMGAGPDLYGRRKDQSEAPIEIWLNPIQTDAGLFTLVAITDVTERTRGRFCVHPCPRFALF